MTVSDVRRKYLEFFKARGHVIVPSSPLRPENDPTTLFTSSGMQPLVPYLLGKEHPAGSRVTNSQKCFRAVDIEEVGDNRHTTFFEMLGNWSFGDYFKQEQLSWIFEFLVDEIGLDPNKMYVTAFIGDEKNGVERDTESVALWKELFKSKGVEATEVLMGSEENGYEVGMQGGRIFYYDAKKNWWSRAGVPEAMPVGEPGGPDSEIFYDFGTPHDPRWGKECHPNCDCGRFLEICNSVFMQYVKKPDGSFGLLPKQNVDFGGGLERVVMAMTGNPDIIAVNHQPILEHLESASGTSYASATKAFRIVADHMKAAVFLIADGIQPSNTDQGYFVRRLIRRAVRYADTLGIEKSTFANIVRPIARMYEDAYPDIGEKAADIEKIVSEEEEKFRKTLTQGMKEFERRTKEGSVGGETAFLLFTSYGFPIELTEELATERGIAVDRKSYDAAMEEHQAKSRAGAAQKFAGGLADHGEQTVRYHTTHHILLKALQMVLGEEVKQRGSNITSERLRIDFSSPGKMTDEQKAEVERIVNETIYQDLPVTRTVMPREEAEKLGAQMEFGVKYPDMVSVYSVGPMHATEENPDIPNAFSLEFCGGPHVTNTKEIHAEGRKFKIQKEEAVAAGIRRIKAVLV